MIKWIKSFFEKEEHVILNEDRKNHILDLLKIAKNLDKDFEKSSSIKHKYKLNPVASMDKLLRAEIKYKFRLPIDYFWFITKVGNGGNGPFCIMEPFKLDNIEHLKSLSNNSSLIINELDEQLLFLGIDDETNKIFIVLSGKNSGNIMYERIKDGKKIKNYRNSFLEWYECWLNNELLN